MQNTSGQDRLLTPVSRKKYAVLAAVGGALALAVRAWTVSPALANLFGTDMTVSRQQLRFATVERGDVRHDVAVQGRIVTANSPALFAPAAGAVHLNVKPGDPIMQGQVVATIVSPELNNQLAQEQTNLQRLSIDYERQQIETRTIVLTSQQVLETAADDVELARSNEYRASESMKSQVISQADTLSMDSAQIEQVLINIVKNAKESGSEPDQIRLSVRQEPDEIQFEVSDRGSGLGKEQLSQAMLPFYTTKRAAPVSACHCVMKLLPATGVACESEIVKAVA